MAPGDQTTTRRKPERSKPKGSKPTLIQLGVDPAKLDWQRSGTGAGSLEVAFLGGESEVSWVLLRVAGDPAGRVLVYDRTEWMCFLDGVGRGEFG
jgi:hypothetical protein